MGITFVNSTGDTGAAECDFGGSLRVQLADANLATQGLAVSYPASSPQVTGVGGTLNPSGGHSFPASSHIGDK